jgi:heat shock protein HspQ
LTRRDKSKPLSPGIDAALPEREKPKMGTVTNISRARFSVGDLVHHRLFGYRGVVADVDYRFQLTDQWYETVAKSRPPKNRPWYHVLVHDALHSTYVAERNLEVDESRMPVEHPLVDKLFSRFERGRYITEDQAN